MELFIPSLITLLIAGILAFAVVPRLSIPIILLLSVLILVVVLRNHYTFFYNEYRYSTWQEQAKAYSPFIILFILVLFILTSISFATPSGGNVPTIPEPAALPAASTATNPITSAINSSLRAASNAASSITETVSNAVSTATNATKKNNTGRNASSSTYNLTALLGSKNNTKPTE